MEKFLISIITFTFIVCFYAGFTAVFTNLGMIGRKGPDSIGSHYKDQDHDGQVTLSSGIQLWTVPRTGEYKELSTLWMQIMVDWTQTLAIIPQLAI